MIATRGRHENPQCKDKLAVNLSVFPFSDVTAYRLKKTYPLLAVTVLPRAMSFYASFVRQELDIFAMGSYTIAPAILIFLASFVGSLLCETPSEQYERGVIVAVAPHPTTPNQNSGEVQYDVSVRVRDTVYVCLYSPPNGAKFVEYSAGLDLLVLVKGDTLTFPSKLTGTTTVPIIRKEALPVKPVLDWSKAPGQYFEMKMQHLTEALDLTMDQQTKIKPILEQEAFDAGEVCFNPVVPRKERLTKWRRIVEASDREMKPHLTRAQWTKLQEVRRDQKKELNKLISEKSDRREK